MIIKSWIFSHILQVYYIYKHEPNDEHHIVVNDTTPWEPGRKESITSVKEVQENLGMGVMIWNIQT